MWPGLISLALDSKEGTFCLLILKNQKQNIYELDLR